MKASTAAARLSYLANAAERYPPATRDALLTAMNVAVWFDELVLPPEFVRLGVDRWDYGADELQHRATGQWPAARPKAAADELDVWLRDGAEQQRQQNWSWRTGEEMEHLCVNDTWWPLFVTLTVDPAEADPRAIIEDGREWAAYRQRVAEVVRQTMGVAQPQDGGPKRAEYMRYVGVVEHGKSREHHHIHALLWLKEIPESWKLDPNEGRTVCNATDIRPLKGLWPWGTVTKASAFRYIGDPWTQIGWKMPIKEGKQTKLRPAREAGRYLMKYATKECKEWNHRIKASRGLGLTRLHRVMSRLSSRRLHAAASRVPDRVMPTMQSSSVPCSLARREARLMSFSRMWETVAGRQALAAWTTSEWRDAYSMMRASVQDGAAPWEMDSEHLRNWLSRTLPLDERNASSNEVQEVWSVLAGLWPADEQIAVSPLLGVDCRDGGTSRRRVSNRRLPIGTSGVD